MIHRFVRTGGAMAIGLGAAVVAARLSGVHLRDVAARIAAVPPRTLAGCAGSACVVLALQALRWQKVMQPVLGLRYREALGAQAVGTMLNVLLPARGGDLLRAQYLGRITGKSRATILGTEVIDRWLDWWGWVPLVGILAVTGHVPRWIGLAVLLFCVALAAGAALIVFACKRRSPSLGGERSRLSSAVGSFRAGLAPFFSRRTAALALIVAPLPWLWEAGAIALASRSFDVRISFATAFFVLVGFNAATVVPSPAGVGALETGGAAVLMLFGVNRANAVAFIFAYHLTQLLPAVVGGALLLMFRPNAVFAIERLGRDGLDATANARENRGAFAPCSAGVATCLESAKREGDAEESSLRA